METIASLTQEKVRQILDERAARAEMILRDCLGRWVSEAEPITVWQQDQNGLNEIVGLTALNDPDATLYVMARLWMN